MLYNDFKGKKLSRLGFGCMRFAMDPATGEIDQAKVNAMFDLAIARGVNYFDTAYPYLGGKSEPAMAEALKKYPRDSYYIADKFPGHSLPGPVDNRALFELSLKKCGVEKFDFYLLHNIQEWSIHIYEDPAYHIMPDIFALRDEGKIDHLGFSCHGSAELLDDFLTRYEGQFEFVQIQLNYLDWSLQRAKEKIDIIARHGLDVWVMEPLRGGKLAALSPEDSARLKPFAPEESDAAHAFRFLQEIPQVKMILSGMNEVDQVEDNLNTFEAARPMSDAERDTLLSIAEGMKKGVPCTACRYCCAGCPVGLDIPLLLECYNTAKCGNPNTASMAMDGLAKDKLPDACVGCGQCAHACPQGIDVPATLQELTEIYATAPKWADTSRSRQESIRKDLHMD